MTETTKQRWGPAIGGLLTTAKFHDCYSVEGTEVNAIRDAEEIYNAVPNLRPITVEIAKDRNGAREAIDVFIAKQSNVLKICPW